MKNLKTLSKDLSQLHRKTDPIIGNHWVSKTPDLLLSDISDLMPGEKACFDFDDYCTGVVEIASKDHDSIYIKNMYGDISCISIGEISQCYKVSGFFVSIAAPFDGALMN